MKNSSINQKKINEIVDDEVIIKQFFERDERAIVNIEQKYGKYCYSIAFRILLNEKDTEECINDTWLKVWDSIPPIIPEILSAFIGKITRNQARCLIYNTGGLDNVTECEVAECDAADESGCELDRVS
jgi:DNA-directed RNA polymerase specialized sigma24 family protein